MIHRQNVISILLLLIGFIALTSQTQSGKASFYSKRATGARSTSGERIHHDSLTCAHRTYPFGTKLRVVNPANGREVVVRVTDRGPHVRGRIIDLSWAAAKQLGIVDKGIATVEVSPVADIVIPYRSLTDVELPELQLEVHERGNNPKPVWQETPEVDSTEVARGMRHVERKMKKAGK